MSQWSGSLEMTHLPVTRPDPTARRKRLGSAAPWIYGLALAFWASSWNLRLSVLMAWLPFEPVAVASFVLVLCVIHRLGSPLALPTRVMAPLVVLVLAFLPGGLHGGGGEYAPVKTLTMVSVILPVILAAVLLLDTPQARRGWLFAQALLGTGVAVTAVLSHDGQILTGRLALRTVDTIATARPIGAAVVVCLLLALGSRRARGWMLLLAALNAVVLVYVGSRGPALYALVTVAIAIAGARFFAGRRVRLVLGVLAGSFLAFAFAVANGGTGGARIVTSLGSDLYEETRRQLLTSAITLGAGHPMGIGWGNFAQESPVGQELANAQGIAYAHNVFAEAFSEGGLVAVVAFASVVAVALARQWRASDGLQGALILGTTAYWLLNAQVSQDLVGNRFMWIALASGIATAPVVTSRRRRSLRRRGTDPARVEECVRSCTINVNRERSRR